MAQFEFSVDRVIARVNLPKNEWLFSAGMGVDVPVNQANVIAGLIVEQIKVEYFRKKHPQSPAVIGFVGVFNS